MNAASATAATLPGVSLALVGLDGSGRIRVTPAPAGAAIDSAVHPWLGEIEPEATARIHALFGEFWNLYPGTAALRATGLFAAIDLELRKAYVEHGDVQRELARRIVARLRDRPGEACIVPVDLADAALLAFEQGRPLALPWMRWLACAAFALGGVAAGVLALVLRREARVLVADGAALYAVHAEDATRARVLWRLVKNAVARGVTAPQVLVLGRPFGAGRSLDGAAAVAARCGVPSGVLLRRPASLTALLLALPAMLRAQREALRVTAAFAGFAGWSPQPKVLSGYCYRLAWGLVHQAWLRRQAGVPRQVVFGHTGVADSTLLEQALRERGVRTTHLLHGVVNGQSFDGASDVALCQCGADVASLKRWSAYRDARYNAAPRPACAAPGERPQWLLLTNLLHPLAPDYQRFGPRSELLLLQQVAAACRLLDLAPAAVTWKPHPIFDRLPEAVRAAVLARVREHGFAQWPDGRPFRDCGAARVILCTVSTTYLDVLRLGRVAMLYDAVPWDRSQFAEQVPARLRAARAPALAAVYQRLCDPAIHALDFAAAWSALGPGEPDPAPEQVLESLPP